MNRLAEAVRTLRKRLLGLEDPEPPASAVELAADANGDRVTSGVLANENGRSKESLLEYVDADEQPEFVLLANQVIIDNGESHTTEYPTRDTQVLVTDQRIVVVLGGRWSDDLWQMSLADVDEIYVDDEDWKEYLILEATRDGEQMTFFVDVTVEENAADLESSVAFVREHVS